MNQTILTGFRCVFLAIIATCAIILTIDVHNNITGPSGLASIRTEALATIKDSREFIKDAKDSLDANYYEVQAQTETITTILKQTSDLLSDTHAGLIGGNDAHGKIQLGVLPELTGSVQDLRAAVNSNSIKTQELLAAGAQDLNALRDGPIAESSKALTATTATIEMLRLGPLTESTKVLISATGLIDDTRVRLNPILDDTHVMTIAGAQAFTAGNQYFQNMLNPKTLPFWDRTVIQIGKQLAPAAFRAAWSRLFPDRVVVQH